MLHLVPLAGARRKVTDSKGQPSLIRKLLQLQFPEPQPPTIAATAVGSDQKLLHPRIDVSALEAPPTANRGYRKGSGVVISPHVHKTAVAPHVIDPIGKSSWHLGPREVVPLDRLGLFGREPLLPFIGVVSNQFLLLGVHRNDRLARRQSSLHLAVDMTKLRIPIWVILPLIGLAIALQAVVLFVEQ